MSMPEMRSQHDHAVPQHSDRQTRAGVCRLSFSEQGAKSRINVGCDVEQVPIPEEALMHDRSDSIAATVRSCTQFCLFRGRMAEADSRASAELAGALDQYEEPLLQICITMHHLDLSTRPGPIDLAPDLLAFPWPVTNSSKRGAQQGAWKDTNPMRRERLRNRSRSFIRACARARDYVPP
jgi:hypothetical protein